MEMFVEKSIIHPKAAIIRGGGLAGVIVSSPEKSHRLKQSSKRRNHVPKIILKKMEEVNGRRRRRITLSEVVSDCVKVWFEDTLREAEAGDTSMQLLVAQMYNHGYGVPKDPQKGRMWINRASNNTSSSSSSIWEKEAAAIYSHSDTP